MIVTSQMDSIISFNSIKVRLIRTSPLHLHRPNLFQFHKGSINTINTVNKVSTVSMFQFHKGSINTISLFRIP